MLDKLGGNTIHVTITNTKEHAMAVAIIERY